jgi:hypothetical protein
MEICIWISSNAGKNVEEVFEVTEGKFVKKTIA